MCSAMESRAVSGLSLDVASIGLAGQANPFGCRDEAGVPR